MNYAEKNEKETKLQENIRTVNNRIEKVKYAKGQLEIKLTSLYLERHNLQMDFKELQKKECSE